ncbi:hypothetical protein PIB30_046466 [Stylosanthes scabra]|uniref:Uncharacterized protein n=1 Tax=Stylosanthes scabra TaxID=79078 RepID=A0ABU6SGC2_9FABA|nr:hypothetical protein [Stylosanthes scabra]
MSPFSSAVKFDIEKFDGRMFFGLWQGQVKDVLIQFRLNKMRKVIIQVCTDMEEMNCSGSTIKHVHRLAVDARCVMVEFCRWLRNFQGKPTWKQYHKISATGHGRDAQQVVSRAMLGYWCVAAMSPFSSAVKFDIEKFDGRMFFGLWQGQVKDVLIQFGLHKMRKVWAYKEKLSK